MQRNVGFLTYTPALLTSACSPLTAASSLSTIVLFFSSFSASLVGLDSGLRISIVFDRLGRKGMGVVGLEERNYASLASTPPILATNSRLTDEAALNMAMSDA